MILELLSAAGGDAFGLEILERTASTPRVQKAVELSLAPAFLLVGIGSIMNVMMVRMTWIAGRIERLCDASGGTHGKDKMREVEWLDRRLQLVRLATKFSTAAASVISIVIALLFVSAYIETRIGTLVAILWVVTIGLLITGLFLFLREALLASDCPEDRFARMNDGKD